LGEPAESIPYIAAALQEIRRTTSDKWQDLLDYLLFNPAPEINDAAREQLRILYSNRDEFFNLVDGTTSLSLEMMTKIKVAYDAAEVNVDKVPFYLRKDRKMFWGTVEESEFLKKPGGEAVLRELKRRGFLRKYDDFPSVQLNLPRGTQQGWDLRRNALRPPEMLREEWNDIWGRLAYVAKGVVPTPEDRGKKFPGAVTNNAGDDAATGGIDLGHGNYLKVVGTDAAGMPQFDPAQLMQLQKDLRGIVPVPVGAPQPVNVRPLFGLDPNSGNDDLQVSQLDPAIAGAEDAVDA
jgi:hypothetical protein